MTHRGGVCVCVCVVGDGFSIVTRTPCKGESDEQGVMAIVEDVPWRVRKLYISVNT